MYAHVYYKPLQCTYIRKLLIEGLKQVIFLILLWEICDINVEKDKTEYQPVFYWKNTLDVL